MKVHILDGVKDAVPTVPWLSICQSREEFVMVRYSDFRMINRWSSARRLRPYLVTLVSKQGHWHEMGSSKTLAGALKAANKLAKVAS